MTNKAYVGLHVHTLVFLFEKASAIITYNQNSIIVYLCHVHISLGALCNCSNSRL